jgi:hypothetical protein
MFLRQVSNISVIFMMYIWLQTLDKKMAPELFNEQKFWIDRGGNNNGIDLTT